MCQLEHYAATVPLGPAGGASEASTRTATTNCGVTNAWGASVRPDRVGGRLRVSPVWQFRLVGHGPVSPLWDRQYRTLQGRV